MDENSNQKILISKCNYIHCLKPPVYFCSKCQQAYYCSLEHQKCDWIKHKKKCITFENKSKQHQQTKYNYIKRIFQFIGQCQFEKALILTREWVSFEKKWVQNYTFAKNQIAYGSSICLFSRLYLIKSSLNEAQQLTSQYISGHYNFLSNINIVQSHFTDQNKEQKTWIAMNKIKLLSALANLIHELDRNSIHIIEILIAHIERFYGKNSLELSNVYYRTGAYFNFMDTTNAKQQAVACYLKAGGIRKEKGSSCFYNAGLIMYKNKNYNIAVIFFKKAIDIFQMNANFVDEKYLAKLYQCLASCFAKLNNYQKTVQFFQLSLFYSSKFKQQSNYHQIINILEKIKFQLNNLSLIQKSNELPKQIEQESIFYNISVNNFQHFWDAQKRIDDNRQQIEKWANNIDDDKLKFSIEPSIQLQDRANMVWAKHKKDKARQEQVISYKKNISKTSEINVEVNNEFIGMLKSNQIVYLNQLCQILRQSKFKTASFDIVLESIFYHLIKQNKLKKDYFFELNPHLDKTSTLLMLKKRQLEQEKEINEEQVNEKDDQQSIAKDINNPVISKENNVVTNKPKTPSLSLSKIKNKNI